ncbi:TBC1 domain family member 4 isoform X3 [Phlebotomus papatasi]|uniref:TBC1 domain family member 4 isoform X3 n=1 Tax=Phlebotomus papatasi TaxID=29031 RepID=UPI0024834614|nr:TBC1 domain family member 4 isoform X3 [Phlebotomus papatasi]
MFTVPFNRDNILVTSISDASTLNTRRNMTELMQQMRDPSHNLGGSVGSIPQSIVSVPGSSEVSVPKALRNQGVHSTPASNLKLNEALRHAQHDGGPSIFTPKMASSKSYTSGLSQSTGTVNSISSGNLTLFSDISPSHSQFFEVMYVGKIKVSHKRVPDTFIDDALPKFKAYDTQRMMRLQEESRRNSLTASCESSSMNPSDSEGTSAQKFHANPRLSEMRIKEETTENEDEETSEADSKDKIFNEKLINTRIGEENKENSSPRSKEKIFQRTISQMTIPVTKIEGDYQQQTIVVSPRVEEVPIKRDRSASIGSIPVIDQNRTMVFLVGRTDLRLISPDRKQVLLYKDFKDIASCAQGHKNPDHFGIICREVQNDGFIAYVFKCQSDHVADDIVAAISQAFITCSEQKKKEKSQIFSCEHCPMLWYHKLCNDIEGLSEKKTQAVIFKRIESLSEEEQEVIMAKYYGAEEMAGHTTVQQIQFLMMLLRAHCESRQQRHIHDTVENRSEFLNQYLGGSTIFMKAKRSLSNSFDHLLKRKGGRDDGNFSKDIISPSVETPIEAPRAAKITSGSVSPSKLHVAEQMKSPMIDIFMKVGNSPKESGENSAASWRQEMLSRVVTPSKKFADDENAQLISPLRKINKKKIREKRTREELRELWKTAIRQTILLSRMEKENATLRIRQNENEIKKIKLEYDEILPCDKQAAEIWDEYIDKHRSVPTQRDPKVLIQAIRNGVPRSKRGEVWMFLAEQHNIIHAPVNTKNFPNFNTPYQALLKNLTEHQHSIFIDLGRTFPNHKYYKQSLGVGQLSLFNLLKAYSILDPELGYCQGLGFICGVLLLHLEEADAFEMLKHLMFKRQMRSKYLPDMTVFQRELYQLSRLLKDLIPELYEWLDRNEISPTLYAAPWILTLFSSQFPLGFVTRVFDLLFLESQEVIFRVAIALLEIHKDELLKRDNFEDIMDYMKNTVPQMDYDKIDQVMRRTFSMDVSRQLSEYQVEYHVLQEEITTQNQHIETLNRTKEANLELETQLQIAQSTISQLEKSKFTQQNQIHALQSQVQSLEVTVETLGAFVNQLINAKHDLEIPGEVRRIVQQIHNVEQRKAKPVFMDRKIGKSISVNSHLGMGLKILEEGNESMDSGSHGRKKSPFFENTFEQIRQQKAAMRLSSFDEAASHVAKKDEIKLPEHIEKAISNMKSPNEIDSGIATPMTPQSSPANKAKDSDSSTEGASSLEPPAHPFSNCEDINFRFNGTTQLKTIRTGHQRTHIGAIPKALSHDDERAEKS